MIKKKALYYLKSYLKPASPCASAISSGILSWVSNITNYTNFIRIPVYIRLKEDIGLFKAQNIKFELKYLPSGVYIVLS